MRHLSSLSKKIISLLLAVILAVPSSVFAGELGTQQPVTRTQMAVMLSVTDEVGNFIKDNALSVVIISALAGYGYVQGRAKNKARGTLERAESELAEQNLLIKDLEKKGELYDVEQAKSSRYEKLNQHKDNIIGRTEKDLSIKSERIKELQQSARTSAEEYQNIYYKNQTLEQANQQQGARIKHLERESAIKTERIRVRDGLKNTYFNNGLTQGIEEGRQSLLPQISAYKKTVESQTTQLIGIKKEMTKLAQYLRISRLENNALTAELQHLQQKLRARDRIIGAQDEISNMIIKINKELLELNAAKNTREAERLTTSIEASIARLSGAKVPNLTLRQNLIKFLEGVSSHLKGKGGIIGMTAVAAAGAALAFISFGEDSSSGISNSRLAVTRLLSATYTETPELLFVTTQQLKKKYGDAVVVDVVYENQAKYAPLIKQQSDIFKNKNVRESAKRIAQYMQSSPERNKAMLLNSLAS